MADSYNSRKQTGERAEAATAEALRSVGFTVINLNDLVGNCPFADLIARKGALRLLVQVKGTVDASCKFGAPPKRVHGLAAIAAELDCRPIYAFCYLIETGSVIRFSDAPTVARLAEEGEANYTGTIRYHVNLGQFDTDISRIDELWV